MARLGQAVSQALEARTLWEENRRAQDVLRDSEERYRLVTENIAEGVFLFDLDGRLVLANRIAELITGYSQEELRGRSISTLFEVGKGTGLGLSTVYGIVKQSNGHIAVDSAPDQGATFKIYLPIVDAPPTTNSPVEGGGAAPGGSETVLLVEDEDALRSLAREILEVRGYTVLEAAGPVEALRTAAAHHTPIHLLLTDVVMPQMNGRKLADRLLSGRPEVKVLFMSGYISHGLLGPRARFLQKPFTPAALGSKIREVLDS